MSERYDHNQVYKRFHNGSRQELLYTSSFVGRNPINTNLEQFAQKMRLQLSNVYNCLRL